MRGAEALLDIATKARDRFYWEQASMSASTVYHLATDRPQNVDRKVFPSPMRLTSYMVTWIPCKQQQNAVARRPFHPPLRSGSPGIRLVQA